MIIDIGTSVWIGYLFSKYLVGISSNRRYFNHFSKVTKKTVFFILLYQKWFAFSIGDNTHWHSRAAIAIPIHLSLFNELLHPNLYISAVHIIFLAGLCYIIIYYVPTYMKTSVPNCFSYFIYLLSYYTWALS